MKKYTLFLASFVFIISLFSFNVNSANAVNCGPGEFFHSSTGRPCVTTPTNNTSTITVISPNGGENWVKGTNQTISWRDTNNISTHEIKLIPLCPTGNTCATSYTIANTQGSSYDWTVGQTWENSSVPVGQYTIKVCQSSTTNCDSSNTPFNISSATTTITTTSPLSNGKVGIYYTKHIETNGGGSGDHWSVSAGNLPPGLELHRQSTCTASICPFTSVISGNPTTVGIYNFTIRMSNQYTTLYTEKRFALTIDPSTVTTPMITSILPPGCTSSTGNSSTNGQPCTSVYMGDTVSIRGLNFTKKNYAVTYSALNGNLVEMRTNYRSSTLLTAVIPTNAGDGPHGIQLKNRRDNTFFSNAISLNFVYMTSTTPAPQISSLSPSSANIGERVYINGSNFSSSSNVFVDGGSYSPVDGTRMVFPATYISSSKLSFIVTSSVPIGTRTVQVNNGTDSSPVLSNVVKLRVTTPPVYIEDKIIDSSADDSAQVLGAEAFNFTQKLRKGSSGVEVMELQKFLNEVLGASGVDYNLTTDGKFGAMTEAALIKFQSVNGLSTDGVVGPLTRAVLNK